MDFKHEFGTVDIILKSDFKTKGVDAFSISLIKVERQIRRIFTFLIFQHKNYKSVDGKELRKVLANNKSMYFKNFINGIDEIYTHDVETIYGKGYKIDFELIKNYTKDRNKIFHGQLTENGLSRKELIERVSLMKNLKRR